MRRRTTNYGNLHGLPGLPVSRPPLAAPPSRRPQPPLPQRLSAPSRPIPTSQPDPMAGRRIDMLEQRLNATEQSNRTLLDELMRVQQDLKMNVKRNEMSLGEERDAMTRLDSAMRQTQGKSFEFEDRIRRLEDAVKDTRSALQQMNSHVKSIEKAVASAQQDQIETRSNSGQRLQEYKHEIMRVAQSKEQLERLCFSLRDELRETTSKVDNVAQEMSSLESNVRMQGRLIEDSSKRMMMQASKVHTPAPIHIPTPAVDEGRVSETVRLALEGKLIQVNATIQDITQRINLEAKKREKYETEVNMRMNELLQDYGSTKVEKDKEMREFDEKMKELSAGFSASEKQRILMEVSSVAKDLSRKMDEKEAKLRDDTVNKLTVIESTLVKENKRRAEQEKALQEKMETQLKEARLYGEHNADALKQHADQHEEKVDQRMTELGRGMAQLEAQMRDHVLEQERVLAAEITDRQNGMKVLAGKIDDVDDRAKMGILELQTAVGTVDKKASKTKTQTAKQRRSSYGELHRMQTENTEGIREQVAKDFAKLDNRLSDVENQMKQHNDVLDHKLQSAKAEDQEANTIMGDKMQQKIDSVIFSHERLKKQVDKLQNEVQDTPKSIANLNDEVKEADERLTRKVDQERKERMDDVKDLRGEVDRIVGKNEANASTVPSLAQLNQDIDDTQTGMKKLAEAVHVVKSSLAERVKDERKLRQQEDSILKRDVDRLNTKYTDLRDKLRAVTAAA